MTEKYTQTYDVVAGLGRHVEHDPKSLEYPYVSSGEYHSVRHSRIAPVFDQGNLGSCTGNAAAGCLGTAGFYDTVKALVPVFDENLAVSIYSEATSIDEFKGTYPPTDTGSSGLGVAKVLKSRGWISGYTHTFTFADALAALTSQPVITGVPWYESFFDPDANGIINLGPKAKVAGGHEFVLDELDVERQLIGATNSWGTSWGVGGRFYIPFAVFQRLLAEKADVTAFVPLTAPAPTPTPLDPDKAYWNSIKKWAGDPHSLKSNQDAAAASIDWAKAKGIY